jgi:hypothetical protein
MMLVTDMLMAILNCCSQEELEAEEEEDSPSLTAPEDKVCSQLTQWW